MSRCEVCGGKDHTTLGHEVAVDSAAAHLGALPRSFDQESLLVFERKADRTVLVANVQRPFLPRGLMLWDVGTLQLEAMLFGHHQELVASFGRVPARWFTVAQSFEQVREAAALGNEPGRGWGTWSSLYPGIQVRLVFDGDASAVQALMWGHTS